MIQVAIQGVAGSYSEEAVSVLFGTEASIMECDIFADTFRAVTSGEVEYAVVPIKNKIVGGIKPVIDLLQAGSFRVADELRLKVQHVLVGTSEANETNLASVRSHIEALKQCQRFLTLNSGLTQIPGTDTASSIKQVVDEGKVTCAAIGSRRAADLYGAKVLRENIADDIDNWTTFYLIGN